MTLSGNMKIISMVYTDHGKKRKLGALLESNGVFALGWVEHGEVVGFSYLSDICRKNVSKNLRE